MFELLVATGLSGIILTAVLTTFVLIGKSLRGIRDYSEIETNARKALENMSREIRGAFSIENISSTAFTLCLPDSNGANTPDTKTYTYSVSGSTVYNQSKSSGAYIVTYSYNSSGKSITRTTYDTSGNPTTSTFISNVEAISGNNIFNYYKLYVVTSTNDPLGVGYVNGFIANTTSSQNEVQQLEVKFLIREKAQTTVDATNKVLSARFVLRNKR